ncbi:hypothetical protein FHT87_005187 [Rhizobium sp. BK316]|uniref:hypothetical protein n=1 Tax=Rhizobium sp. BK316 TaxID=2587053 RepID=UPI00160F5894|nr:hypothetical protein [Rhizobium sp. BK316]MBB3411234.1 hypothetical protein [Rhizobium sp. BK316]
MNHFAIGTQPVRNGYLAWFRRVHKATNEIIKSHGKPVIYPTEEKARAAAADALLVYLNSEMVRDGEVIGAARKEAGSVFRQRKEKA